MSEETNTEARDRGYKDGEAGKPPTPNHDYHDERSAAYIDGHRLGAMIYLHDHEPDSELDIHWPLDEGVQLRVTRLPDEAYLIEDVDSDRKLTLSWRRDGTDWSRLLFDGQDIETEEYMGYIGLMDEVTELLGPKGVGTVTLERNHW